MSIDIFDDVKQHDDLLNLKETYYLNQIKEDIQKLKDYLSLFNEKVDILIELNQEELLNKELSKNDELNILKETQKIFLEIEKINSNIKSKLAKIEELIKQELI